ncbi:MAG: hypothetical protein AB7F86_16770 [Bdellovibrionales bacterium]
MNLLIFLLSLLPPVLAADLRLVNCDESKVVPIFVRPNFGTIVNFPVKPDHVLLGGGKQFGIEYIKNDIALTALFPGATTNMFVYLFGRRCGFLIKTSGANFDSVVRVRDPDENKIRVKINE